MTVRLDWRICGNALMHVRLCKFLVALANKHFNSLSVKHRFPSQRSKFDSKSGKHPWILFWYSVTALVIEYRRRCRSCTSLKMLASAYVEPNLGRDWRVGIWRREGRNKPFFQKGLLINAEVQNSRKACPSWILKQKRKRFAV